MTSSAPPYIASRRNQLGQADPEVAHPGVRTQRRALQALRVEEADMRHRRRKVAGAQTAQQRDRREHGVVGARVLDRKSDPQRRSSSIVVLHTVQLRPAEDRYDERIQRAEHRTRDTQERRQPEELIGRELEADRGSSTTITLHTTQTANASSNAGIDTSRLRVAMRRPFAAQNPSSSGLPVDQDMAAAAGSIRSAPSNAARASACLARMPSRSVALGDPHPDHRDDDHEESSA